MFLFVVTAFIRLFHRKSDESGHYEQGTRSSRKPTIDIGRDKVVIGRMLSADPIEFFALAR